MKYKNEAERKKARRLQNRMAKRKQRANEKLKKKQDSIATQSMLNFTVKYPQTLFKELESFAFSHHIILTHDKKVTINMHNSAVDNLLEKWVKEGHIWNYFKVTEYEGNYHGHILVQEAARKTNFKSLLSRDWQSGYTGIKEIENERDRVNKIKYCLKQLKAGSTSSIMQSLIDSWSLRLTVLVENVEYELLRAFKEKFNLNVKVKKAPNDK